MRPRRSGGIGVAEAVFLVFLLAPPALRVSWDHGGLREWMGASTSQPTSTQSEGAESLRAELAATRDELREANARFKSLRSASSALVEGVGEPGAYYAGRFRLIGADVVSFSDPSPERHVLWVSMRMLEGGFGWPGGGLGWPGGGLGWPGGGLGWPGGGLGWPGGGLRGPGGGLRGPGGGLRGPEGGLRGPGGGLRGDKDGRSVELPDRHAGVVSGKRLVGRLVPSPIGFSIARVQLLLDPLFRVRFRAGDSTGMLWGTGLRDEGGQALLEVHHVVRDVRLSAGFEVVTAGNDGVFPPGILIGEMVSDEDAAHVGGKIYVRSALDPTSLDHVAIVVDRARVQFAVLREGEGR